jgi:hypothetical protein
LFSEAQNGLYEEQMVIQGGRRVHRVYDTVCRRVVAIKQLIFGRCEGGERRRIVEEARCAWSASHQHVVKIYNALVGGQRSLRTEQTCRGDAVVHVA